MKHIHACEINPNSIHALEWSAKHNQVQSRLTVHSQDNQITLSEFEGAVDRVLLGYLPSSEATWEPAVRALKATGGTLHIHMNVEEERIESWCQETMQKCVQYAKDADGTGEWFLITLRKSSGTHLESVTWSWTSHFLQ